MGLSSNGKDADRDGGIIAANFAGVWHFNREKSAMRGPVPKRMIVTIDHRESRISQLSSQTGLNRPADHHFLPS
jgi:hypothetical protein